MISPLPPPPDLRLRFFVDALLARKAEQLVVLDMRHLTTIADYFFLASARSHRQVTAIAEHVLTDLRTRHIRPLSVEGLQEGHWALLDYGDVVVHVFYDPVRHFYDLEGLWLDAPRMRIAGLNRGVALPPANQNTPADLVAAD